MAASEIATVSGTIIQITRVIQELGNNWYKASADWEDFPRKIAWLQRKHDFWVKEIRRFNMLSDPSLMATLREAEKLLADEKAKLEAREAGCGAGCWSKGSRTVFPAKVGLRIQLVIDVFDAIPGFLRMEEEGAAALESRMMRSAPSLAFRDDDRYVPLKITESKVHKALVNSHGSPLVLLHGGPGKGKSTLARHVALHYQKECNNPESPFELVVFLECGPKANILTNQFKLAQLLGANTGATAVPQEQQQTGSDAAIRRRLSGLLKHQRILIVWDDVWERDFLQEILNLCGVGVKWLVTSQHRNLCRGLSLSHPAIQIQIEDVKDDVAMQILASHVGFTDKKIPAHIQRVAHKMLEGADGNPLALASVATAIDYNRSDEVVVWEAASHNFLKLLHSTDTAYTLGQQYSKSFWSATQLSMQSLKEGAQNLLILLHMCEAPSVPEEVLRILYGNAIFQAVSETFEASTKDLESRQLVKISNQSLEYDTHRKLYSWTLHSSQKLFIAQETSDEKETVLKVRKDTMLQMLVSQYNSTNFEAKIARLKTKNRTDISAEEDSMVQLSLCSLYFQEQYLNTVLKIESRHYQLNSLRRNAIEPITRLLALPPSERWTEAAQGSAKQIYLTYIYNDALHDTAILDLLALPVSALPVLQALEDIAMVESETTLIDENSGALMKALLNFLGNVSDAGNTSIAMAAAKVLLHLSHKKLYHGVIISSGIFNTIEKILSSDSHPDLQVASTGILQYLACEDQESNIQIMQHPRIIEELLQSMSSNKIPYLTKLAAEAFVNFTGSGNDFCLQQLMNFPGLMEQLVNLLSKENSRDLQVLAAMALANVAHGDVEQIIVQYSSAVQQLLASTFNNDSPELQLQAAKALVNLCVSENDIAKQKLVNFPGLLKQLVNLLSKANSPQLQVYAAEALANLTSCKFPDVKQKILNYSHALRQLLACTPRNDNPELQLHATGALVNLTAMDNDITKQQLVNFPGLLEQLLKLLSQKDSPDLQVWAAMVLRNLTSGDVIQIIVDYPGAVQKLLAATSRNDSPKLQRLAIGALVNLTASNITGRQLVNFPGLLEQLVNLLLEEDSTDLQVQAAMALQNLARGDVIQIIVDYSGALQQLLASTSRNDSPELQRLAIGALVNLTAVDNDITKQQLVNFPGLLQQLVNLLSKENDLDLQADAAMALKNLAHGDAIQRIVDYSGAVQQLLASTSRNDSPELQRHAIGALVNLTTSNNDITKQQLVNFHGFLEQLVNLLSQKDSADLQVLAAMALEYLARGDVIQIIVDYSGAVQKLLAATSRNDSPKLQLHATRALMKLTTSDKDIIVRELKNFPGLLEQLVNLLSQKDLNVPAAMALRNLGRGDAIQIFLDYSGALPQLLEGISRNDGPRLQLKATTALLKLSGSGNDNIVQQLINFPGLLEQLVNLLSKDDNDDLRSATAKCLRNIAASQVVEMRLKMMRCSGLLETFFSSSTNGRFCEKSGWAYYVEALTYLDPVRGNGARLHSALAYSRRAMANISLDLNKEALDDLNKANAIEPGDVSTLSARCTARARLGDVKGALADSNIIIEKQRTASHLQERGVLKRMMEDLPGALADLNESLELKPDDYEVLKHRGFVRFLMQDETGAHLDAQMACKLKPSSVDAFAYGHDCLGTSPVEFLDYKLR